METKNNEEDYWIDNIPPEFTDKNYPPVNTNNQQTTSKDNQEEINVIQETPISQLHQENSAEIVEFTFLPVIATIPTTTPVTIDITTSQTIDTTTAPATIVKTKQYNKALLIPTYLNKKSKIISQEKIQQTALEMTQRLAKFNYRDTSFLSNATPKESNKIIAL